MLTHPTHDRLVALGLTGMAKALEEQRKQWRSPRAALRRNASCERWRKIDSSSSLNVPFIPSSSRSLISFGSYTPSSSMIRLFTRVQNSRRVRQSRPLRARREASMASTAPAVPVQIAANKRSKPGRAVPPPERPRSSSMTITFSQPSARARVARPY